MGHTTLELNIGGMTCDNCVRHVTEALRGVDGVQGAEVDLEAARAKVIMDDGTPRERLVGAVQAAGYEAA